MTGYARAIAVGAVASAALAACGGAGPSMRGGLTYPSSPTSITGSALLLPVSSAGPTTCTVYESDYGTQIVVDSQTLDVRTQCLVWAANRLGVGYLWGYERSAVLPAGARICSLTDPQRRLTASVVDTVSLVGVPGYAAERARGIAVCASIVASGWRRAGRAIGNR